MRRSILRVVVLLYLAVAFGCADGTDSSSISSNDPSFVGGTIPLSVAERVTVVDAKEVSYGGSSVKALDADFGKLAEYYYIPSGTPFYTDVANVYVNEKSADMFQTVNEVLCALERTGYKEMMNKGIYVAMIPETCTKSAEETNVEFMRWVVRSSRESSSSPHIIDVWFQVQDGPDEIGKIELKAEITESKSESNPFGIFRVDYALYFGPDIDNLTMFAKFFMRTYRDPDTEKVLLDFAMDVPKSRTQLAVMDRGKDNLSGSGSVQEINYVYNTTTIDSSEQYNFAFNDTHFRRQDIVNSVASGDACYFRNSFNEDVWSYGLYDVSGDRFDLNTGFPISYIYNGVDHYGYISYWGLSLYDENAPLISGDTLFRDDSSPYAGTAYELLLARGKLTKHYTIQKTLDDFQNMDMDYSYWDYGGAGGWQQVRLRWNGSVLNKVAVYNSTTYDYEPVVPQKFPMTNVNGQTLNVYSQVGSMEVLLSGCIPDLSTGYSLFNCADPTASTPVKMRQYSTVTPNDAVAVADLANGLLCFRNCPEATQMQNLTSPYYYPQSTDFSMFYQQGTSPTSGFLNTITYTFDQNTMQLQDDAASLDAVFADPSDPNSYEYIKSGPMITNTTANRALLVCGADPSSTCADNVDNFPVYYTWRAGSYSGEHLALLKDLGTSSFFTFDEPLPLSYTYKGAGSYYGQTFLLSYYGFDDWLSGIPTKCVNPDDWSEMVTNDCYGDGGRSVNAFNVPFGGKLTYTEDDGTVHEYFAKALSKEQYMLKLSDTGPCDIITVQSYPLPDPDAGWSDPSLGPTPVIDAPPAVVDGELQTN